MKQTTLYAKALGGACLCLSLSVAAPCRAADWGVFEVTTDVGDPSKAGGTEYDAEAQTYALSGGGLNMWFGEDEFHFAHRKMSGNFILSARIEFLGEGVNAHRKMGWMVRPSLEKNSPHASVAVHGDGLTSLQYRREAGADTEELKADITGADVIELERRGGRFIMRVATYGQPFSERQLDDLDLGDEVYVGLFVCSHDPQAIEKGLFKNVRITVPAKPDFTPYQDYIGSRLETLNVDTGDRKVLYTTPDAIEAPNWTPDGKTLIYNGRGRLFSFPLAEGKPSPLDTGFVTNCNNDHVLSLDGTMLGISSFSQDDGGSIIYTLPATGGTPTRITEEAPSYLHGWSPDAKYLVYTAERHGNFDIYRIPATGGAEVRLTDAEGLDDGPEYSPDGKSIYFNSARTGTMQLWRMKADGSEQEQLTHDELHDWFPHVSPDGRRIVFLSFPKDVRADDHPYYQHVYLRTMPVGGGEPKVIAYLYGGQGTINVPSWSPDNTHVAFVSHSD